MCAKLRGDECPAIGCCGSHTLSVKACFCREDPALSWNPILLHSEDKEIMKGRLHTLALDVISEKCPLTVYEGFMQGFCQQTFRCPREYPNRSVVYLSRKPILTSIESLKSANRAVGSQYHQVLDPFEAIIRIQTEFIAYLTIIGYVSCALRNLGTVIDATATATSRTTRIGRDQEKIRCE